MSNTNADVFVGWLGVLAQWGAPIITAIVGWWASRRASGKKCEQVCLRLLIAIEKRAIAHDTSRSPEERADAEADERRAIKEAKAYIYASLGMTMEDF
jgi:hypothetical protein